MLTGEIKSAEDLPEGDFRRTIPRFQPGSFEHNIKLVEQLKNIAKDKGCTPAQLAISWVKSQSRKDGNPEIIPIPGATTAERVEENCTDIALTGEDLKGIELILKEFEVVGGRYGGPQVQYIEG